MLRTLRRAACQLLAAYPQHAAATAAARGPPPAAAAAATAALQHARWLGSSADTSNFDSADVQPFSLALLQLESSVTDPELPADALAANKSALATLKDFAKGLESPYSYPPAAVKNVVFVIRDPFQHGKLQKVRCQLKTTGGNCEQLVQQSLGALLARMGHNPYFFFDGEQFRPKARPRPQQQRPLPRPAAPAAKAKEPSAAEVEAVRAKAAAAGFPSQTISEEEFNQMSQQSAEGREARRLVAEQAAKYEADLKRLDPLLQGVAAVPWMVATQEPEQLEKVKVIKTKVLDEIEAWGWDVRGPARRIWAGERNAITLMQGKDSGTQLAIKHILYHAINNDKKYGGKKTWQG